MAYRRTGHVAWRRVGGQVVVINLRTSTVLGLNEAGGGFWDALASGPERAVACGEPAASGFLGQLEASGFLEATDAPPELTHVFAAAPAVEWQETLQVFAANCNWVPGQNDDCNASPGS